MHSFLQTPDKPLSSTTQDLVPVADIIDGVVIYKNGGAAQIMETTSLNFGLLSEMEQEAVIASYAGLLNSFNFPVQIVVRTQKKDISSYMNFLASVEKNVKNPKLQNIMTDYKAFVIEAIKKKNVLSKKFYIVIPFTPYELGVGKSVASSLRPKALPYPKSYVVRKAKIALLPKKEHLVRQAGRLNIHVRPLSNDDLLRLFYNTFNPEPPMQEKMSLGEV
ncbi:hypothetical protein KKB40_04435 [Patescibacteria group bacterium]|nr:hypothetical protein [Patescibacteria group bacterium]